MAEAPGHPAAPSGGDRWFFDGADFGRRLHLLQHLTQSSDLVLVVSGPAGSGKSTLLEKLLASTDRRWQFCTIQASVDMRARDVLQRLADCCDLPRDCGEVAWSRLLAERAASLAGDDRVPVMLVDDAHLLENGALANLAQLAAPAGDNPRPWHLVLFSEPGLEATLVNGRDKLAPISKLHILRLNPLTIEETADYVGHKLEGDAPLSTDQIKRLHRDSGGLPGRIDSLLARAPGTPPPEPAVAVPPARRRRTNRRRYVRLAGALTLVVAAALVLMFQDRINALFQPRQTAATSTSQTAGPTTAPTTSAAIVQTPAGDRPALPPTDKAGVVPPPVPAAPPPPPAPPAPPSHAAAGHAPATTPPTTPAAMATPPTAPEQATVAAATRAAPPAGAAPQRSTKAPAHANAKTSAQPATAHEPKARPPSAPTVTTPSPSAVNQTAAAKAASAARPARAPHQPPAKAPATAKTPATPTAPATEPRRKPPTGTTTKDRYHGPDWLLAQQPERYTMQLAGSRHPDTARKYLREHHLTGDAAVYHVQYRGKPWYVLVYGVYHDLAAARGAVQKLPPAVRRDRPWIRRMGAVQTELRRGHK